MAATILVSRNFDLGFQSDISREQLGKGAAYRLYDWIPQNEAPVRKRGGYAWATVDLNSLASASSVIALGWAPFATDPHLIEISDSGNLFKSTRFDGAAGDTFIGAATVLPTYRPFWHRDRMVLLPGIGQAATTPKKYYDSGGAVYVIADIAGTPPQARVGWSWGDYLVLANGYVSGTLFSNRIWYSSVANPDSWTVGTSLFDIVEIEEIVAGTVLRNVQVVWGYSSCWMLLGDTPPPGGNLTKRSLFQQGCMDGRTLTKYKEYAIWANEMGVWKTDGSTLTDLTAQSGISIYWRSLVETFSPKQGWSACAGLLHNEYWVSISNPAGVTLATVIIDIERQTSRIFTNVKTAMFAERSAGPGTALADGHEELFFAHRTLPRVGQLSGVWHPSSTNAYDADGLAVEPSIETGYYTLGTSAEKRLREAMIGYDLRALAGTAPTLLVEKVTSPESSAYVACDPTLPATTKKERRSVDLSVSALGVGLRIKQQGASADTRLGEIEIGGHPWEASHDGR